MKKVILYLMCFIGTTIMAQPAISFNYQAVLRDANGVVLSNQNVGIQISILSTSATGTAIYVETHNATTNDFGLITLAVGGGTASTGTMAGIAWGSDRHFMKVGLDASGGSSYVDFGTQEILWVPYALHAASADNVDDADADATNELQMLSISNDSLSISNGNTVYLPALVEVDADTTNELQSLSLMGDTLMISDGNYVRLTDYSGIWESGANGVHYNNGYVGIGAEARSNRSLYIDHTGANNSTVEIRGDRQYFNTIQFSDSTDEKRISIGMTSEGSYDNAYSIGTYNGAWTNPFILQLGAPDGSIYVDTSGNVGVGSVYPSFQFQVMEFNGASQSNEIKVASLSRIEGTDGNNRAFEAVAVSASAGSNFGVISFAENGNSNVGAFAQSEGSVGVENIGVVARASNSTGSNFGVYAVTNGGATNASGNAAVRAVGNTDSSEVRSMYSTVSGAFSGYGTFSEAQTMQENVGVAGYGLSRSGNNFRQTGVRGVAQGDWNTALGVGNGEHIGVSGLAVSDTGWALGGRFESNSNVGSSRGVQGAAFTTNGDFAAGVIGFANSANTNPNLTNSGVYGSGNSGAYNYGVYGYNSGSAGVHNAGVYGYSNASATTSSSYGVDGTSQGTTEFNVGVGGFSHATNTGAGKSNVGMFGYAVNADTNIAVYAQALGSGLGTNIGVYAVASNATYSKAGVFDGNVEITGNLSVTGSISKGSGTFKIDHPLDPENKYLIHSFVESPEMLNVYSGNITTDKNGEALVALPAYFKAANKDYRYQLTPIGQFAQAIVLSEIGEENSFVVKTDKPNVKISWQVTAVRADNYAEANRIEAEVEKENDKKGTYLHPEAYGKEPNKRMLKTREKEFSDVNTQTLHEGSKLGVEADNNHSHVEPNASNQNQISQTQEQDIAPAEDAQMRE